MLTFNGQMHPRIAKVGTKFFFEAPILSEIMLHFEFVEISEEEAELTRLRIGQEPTAYVGLEPRLVFGWYKGFIDSLTDQELTGLIIHELSHIMNLTHDRFSARGYTRDKAKLWNVAADFVINKIILESTIGGDPVKLPSSGCFPKQLIAEGYTVPLQEWTHESVMDFILEVQKNAPPQQGGKGPKGPKGPKGQGQGGGEPGEGEPQDGENEGQEEGQEEGQDEADDKGKKPVSKDTNPEDWQTHDDHTQLDAVDKGSNVTEARAEQIRNIVNGAQAKGYGSLPGSFKAFVDMALTPPKANWRRKIKLSVSHEIKNFRPDGDRVWNRPSRREYIPLKAGSVKPVYIWVDASGSVFNAKSFGEFFSEVEGIIHAHAGAKVFVGQWDTEVTVEPAPYKKGVFKKTEVKGGGGTSPQCIFDWSNKNGKRDSLHIILTDGEFGYSYKTHGVTKVIWAVIGNDKLDPSCGRQYGETLNLPGN